LESYRLRIGGINFEASERRECLLGEREQLLRNARRLATFAMERRSPMLEIRVVFSCGKIEANRRGSYCEQQELIAIVWEVRRFGVGLRRQVIYYCCSLRARGEFDVETPGWGEGGIRAVLQIFRNLPIPTIGETTGCIDDNHGVDAVGLKFPGTGYS
jgi:hypothetical protein